ncbi:DUF2975 domain-containing protein [Pantoea agglomerans]|uniref:DUF2975 domain-containing protein n=1 Tax=Enterobacter agglomerans TaxID=549 RepID=UPI0013BDAAC3|nr:DUF2975 domain-containing protein [Pantoea agglomerans]NEG59746.1 DUF2975 domain-containing protein [Pantoea agglomerans]NEH00807.1 DUF2975 domain-containing protein [Pantoea agglomerans]NEH05154.1 DUF2975 domain-containing protein [Pantoea agglomerans]NEH16313.1 DUF2975 domain-containing protein [Pantoea agglomerans]
MYFQKTNNIKLVKLCRVIKLAICIGLIALPVSSIFFPLIGEGFFRNSQGEVVNPELKIKFLYIGIEILTDIFPILFLLNLYTLFSSYQRMAFFSQQQVILFKKMGNWLFMTAISSLIVMTARDVLSNSDPDTFNISISFDSSILILLCASLVSYCIGLVMHEALINKHEIDLTI